MSKNINWRNIVLAAAMLLVITFPLTAQGAVEKKTTINYFSGRVETVDWTDAKGLQ